jgi:hypothetical protein
MNDVHRGDIIAIRDIQANLRRQQAAVKRKSWRASEKAMTNAAIERKVQALENAIIALQYRAIASSERPPGDPVS